jgi:hypothetical protein
VAKSSSLHSGGSIEQAFVRLVSISNRQYARTGSHSWTAVISWVNAVGSHGILGPYLEDSCRT